MYLQLTPLIYIAYYESTTTSEVNCNEITCTVSYKTSYFLHTTTPHCHVQYSIFLCSYYIFCLLELYVHIASKSNIRTCIELLVTVRTHGDFTVLPHWETRPSGN